MRLILPDIELLIHVRFIFFLSETEKLTSSNCFLEKFAVF